MKQVSISADETAEVILAESDTEEVTVQVTGDGRILVSVMDPEGNERVFFRRIHDLVNVPEDTII